MSIEKIVENIDTIRALFKKYGFENVRLFKGFDVWDEKTFYLTAAFQTDEKDWFGDIDKKKQLEGNLKSLLGCYVNMTFENAMNKNYLKDVNGPEGSVNLSEVIEKTALRKNLESYFGQGWQFNTVNPHEEEKAALPVAKMYAFQSHPIPANLTPSIFVKPTTELSATSFQKIEERVNEFNNKLSDFTNDELIALRAKLIQSIDQKLSDSQLVKKLV